MADVSSPIVNKKPAWLSKTLWTNFILALSALFLPSVGDFIASNPEAAALGWSVINMVLRWASKDQLSIDS